jgi:hypothetical protein
MEMIFLGNQKKIMNNYIYLITGLLGGISSLVSLTPFVFSILDIYWYVVSSTDKYNFILNKIKWSSKKTCDFKPLGFFFNWNYIGYINSKSKVINIITFRKTFEELTKNNNIIQPINAEITPTINIYNQYYVGSSYCKRTIPIKHKPNNEQQGIIDNISDFYKNNDTCVALLCGSSGTGKSYLGFLLTLELNGNLYNEYNPTKNDSNFILITSDASKDTPTIVILDEIDILFEKIKNGIELSEKYNPCVYDKPTWNNFMDNIKLIYPYTIIILTSNLTKEEINAKYDESFIRKGRVDLFYEMNNIIIS